MINLVYHNNFRNRTLTVPEAWHELTASQFVQLAAILHSEAPTMRKLDRILKVLSGKSMLSFLLIPADIRARCFEHIAWVLQEQTITKQLLPKYKGFYGPESDFDNMVLSEFHHSETAYFEFVKTGSTDALNELIAVLYRKPKAGYNKKLNKDGDIRRPFSFGEMLYNKKQVAKWNPAVKLAVVLWYDSCRQALVKLYPTAFNGESAGADQGLYKMIRSLSGDKYGTFSQVETMGLHTAFLEIVCSMEEYEELKKKNLA